MRVILLLGSERKVRGRGLRGSLCVYPLDAAVESIPRTFYPLIGNVPFLDVGTIAGGITGLYEWRRESCEGTLSSPCCLVCASRIEAGHSGGTGTELDPYLIATARDLADLSLDEDNWNRHSRLIANIDMGDFPSTLISTTSNDELSFSCIFNGSDRTTRNRVCTSPSGDPAGLLGRVRGNDALICNVVLVDPNVEAEATDYVGVAALVGRLRSCPRILRRWWIRRFQ